MAMELSARTVRAKQSCTRAVDQFRTSGWTQVHRGTSEEDMDERLKEAIPLWKVWGLKYQVGQRMRITVDREADRLRSAKAVVLGDYDQVVLVDVVNGYGQHERMQIQKVDIIREHVGDKKDRKGALRIELC